MTKSEKSFFLTGSLQSITWGAARKEKKSDRMRESKDHILPGGSAEAQRADMLRAMEAVSAKMAAERGITRQPLAVLSQSEISRRMSAI